MPLSSGEQQRVIQAQRDAQHALEQQIAKQLNIKPREVRQIESQTVTVGAPMISSRQGGGNGDVGGRPDATSPDPSSQFSLTFRTVSGSSFVGLTYGSEVLVGPTNPATVLSVTNCLSSYPAADSDPGFISASANDIPYIELDVTYTSYPPTINSATFKVATTVPPLYEHDGGVGSSPVVFSQLFARLKLGLITLDSNSNLYAQSSRNSQLRVLFVGQTEATNHSGSSPQFVWCVSLI